jgi:hypothetical protein
VCIKGEIEDVSPAQEEHKQPRRIRLERRFSGGNSNGSDKQSESDIVNQNSSREEIMFMHKRS